MSVFDAIFGIVNKVFGGDGIVGAVIGGLKSVGILKDPVEEQKAKEFLMNYELQVKNQMMQELQMQLEDLSNARAREIATKDMTPRILAYVSFFGFFLLLGMILFYPLPTAVHDAFNIMLGILGGIIASVVSYYFGSSSGSADRTKALTDLLSKVK